MSQLVVAILVLSLSVAGLSFGARHAFMAATWHQTQLALDQARPHLLSLRAVLAPATHHLSIDDAARQRTGAEALDAAHALAAVAQSNKFPGFLGAEAAAVQSQLEQLRASLASLGQASQQPFPSSALLRQATAMASLSAAIEREQLAPRGLTLGLPPADTEQAYRAAWLVAWAQDLQQFDTMVAENVQTWLAWQQTELPTLIEQDRWKYLDEKTAVDVEAVAQLRGRFETLAAPQSAATVSSTYADALQDLENAHRHLRNYLLSKTGVPRELRLSAEMLATHESSRREALRMLKDLLAQSSEERP